MKLPNSWLLVFPVALFLAPQSWAADPDVLFPGVGGAPSPFDMTNVGDAYGSGNPGNQDPVTGAQIGNTTPGVLGESHPGWGADQVNGGPGIPGPISDYPTWSTHSSGNGLPGPNERHQFPIGVRGGVPETSTRLIAPLNQLMTGTAEGSGFEGQHTFGFTGDQSQDYLGVRSTYKGVAPQSGGTLQPVGTGAVNVNITDGY